MALDFYEEVDEILWIWACLLHPQYDWSHGIRPIWRGVRLIAEDEFDGEFLHLKFDRQCS